MKCEPSLGVGVGQDDTALLDIRHDGDSSQSGQLAVLGEAEVLVVEVLVDDTDHAALAVVAHGLGAVVPDGLRVVLDDDLEHIGRPALLGTEVEAGEEAGAVGQGLAGVGKVGLDDGVVEGQELELDNVTNLGDDVVRLEAETAETGGDGVGDTGQGDSARRLIPRGGSGSGLGAGGEEEDGGDGGLGEHLEGVCVLCLKN